MRTLPLFFIVLVSVSVLTGEILSKDFFKYLILIQKTFPDFINNDYYPVAWSLSIEEFFYILFPVILINLNKNKNRITELKTKVSALNNKRSGCSLDLAIAI